MIFYCFSVHLFYPGRSQAPGFWCLAVQGWLLLPESHSTCWRPQMARKGKTFVLAQSLSLGSQMHTRGNSQERRPNPASCETSR